MPDPQCRGAGAGLARGAIRHRARRRPLGDGARHPRAAGAGDRARQRVVMAGKPHPNPPPQRGREFGPTGPRFALPRLRGREGWGLTAHATVSFARAIITSNMPRWWDGNRWG